VSLPGDSGNAVPQAPEDVGNHGSAKHEAKAELNSCVGGGLIEQALHGKHDPPHAARPKPQPRGREAG
jgi:hypothetical protein